MVSFIERILDGEAVPFSEIWDRNATMIINRVAAFEKSPCKKSETGGKRDCGKNCDHGGSRDIDIAYAAELTERAANARRQEAR